MNIKDAVVVLQVAQLNLVDLMIEVERDKKLSKGDKERISTPLFMARVEIGNSISCVVKWGRKAHTVDEE